MLRSPLGVQPRGNASLPGTLPQSAREPGRRAGRVRQLPGGGARVRERRKESIDVPLRARNESDGCSAVVARSRLRGYTRSSGLFPSEGVLSLSLCVRLCEIVSLSRWRTHSVPSLPPPRPVTDTRQSTEAFAGIGIRFVQSRPRNPTSRIGPSTVGPLREERTKRGSFSADPRRGQ